MKHRDEPTRLGAYFRLPAACCAALALLAGAIPCSAASPRMIVLGIDGMDPEVLEAMMDAGQMPNFARLREQGDYRHLGTSVPPQSPVAWSNFITGLDSGGHGIFDFIHRDPSSMLPYMSTAKVEGGTGRKLRLGKYEFPLSPPRTVLLREGRAFWELLDEQGIPTTIFKIPSNYPPTDYGGRSLSGMGTPDLLGTPGTFAYFTDDPAWFGREIEGGVAIPVRVEDNVIETALAGPTNTFLRADEGERHPSASAPLTIYLDPANPVVRIEIGGQTSVLEVGEWSEWLVVEFELVPFLVRTSGIVRFYLMDTEPHLRLYATPLNLNPKDPAQPISTPPEYSEELCEQVGFFYTQGMPEDTKALTGGVFDDLDFYDQAKLVLEERERLFDHVLESWEREGLLFFYFSSVDQQCHVMWHHTDPLHPAHDPERAALLGHGIEQTYKAMDRALGKVLAYMDDQTTLIVMSDHGFAPFRRAVHLNRWLVDNGYLTLKQNAPTDGDTNIFVHVDWSKTKAYALGLNLLYVNLQGRERWGSVPVRERRQVAEQIAAKLLALRDPRSGEHMVSRTYLREEVYHGPNLAKAPDLVVGYAAGYRASWQTALGQIPPELVIDNQEKWSGDHCMDHTAVPGILLSNRPIEQPAPELIDLTVTILEEFGIPKSGMMRGRSMFGGEQAAR